DLFGALENVRNPGGLQSKMGFLDEELRKGYRQEALTLNAAMENMTRIYLTRFQALEKELQSAEWEAGRAEKQQWEAQETQSELLRQNWQLLNTLQQLRGSMEKQGERKERASRAPPQCTSGKCVGFPHRRHHLSFI
ncbi:hypothetical protein FKM82_026841, partial [Ascaphus truei]